MPPPRLSLLLLAIAAILSACTAETGPGDEAEPIEREGPEDCLLMVWSGQVKPRIDFDRAHDAVEGGAISCATGTSASEFDAAITALREAARSGNKAHVLEQLGLPLLYIDAEGERREIEDRREVEEIFDEVFDQPVLDALQRIDLSSMSVDPDNGAYFELGALWLVVDKDGGRPRLVTVNRQALDEAAEAAREQAARNQGEPVPFDKR